MPPARLSAESLEIRVVPDATGIADTFDTARYPYAPDSWQQWASNGSQYYAVNRAGLAGNRRPDEHGHFSAWRALDAAK